MELLSDGASDSGDGAYTQYQSRTEVSPIISLSYAASVIWNRNFGDMTFVLYGIFVLIQAAIHLREKGEAGRSLLMKDALQFPLSIAFTRFLNVFSACIPPLEECGPAASDF